MKTTLFAMFFGFACITASAQTEKPLTFGIKGGVNFSKMVYKNSDSPVEFKFSGTTNFRAGAFANLLVNNNLALQTGIYYNVVAGKYESAPVPANSNISAGYSF